MAWEWDDPFDDYINLLQRWDAVASAGGATAPFIVQGFGRRTTAAMKIPGVVFSGSAFSIAQKNLPYRSTYILHVPTNVPAGQTPNTDTILCSFMDGATPQITVMIRADGHIRVTSNGYLGTILGDSTAPLAFGDSHCIEIKATSHSSAGVVTIRIDETVVLTITGANTAPSGNNRIGALQMGGVYAGTTKSTLTMYVDDLIILNTVVGDNPDLDDFIGDHYLGAIYARAAGDSTQFTVEAAAANWEAVIDMPDRHNTGTYDTWVATADNGNPAGLLDGSPLTRWRATTALPHTLDFDMSGVRTLESIYLQPYPTSSFGENPGHIELYVSDDGAAWGSVVDTIDIPQDANPVYWKLVTPQTHRYFRLKITTNWGGAFGAAGATSLAVVSAIIVYVEDVTAGDTDLYPYQPVDPSSGAIAFASVWPYANKTDGGYRALRVACKSGVTTTDNGADIPLSTQVSYLPVAYEIDPDTGDPWTISGFNAAQFGPKMAT